MENEDKLTENNLQIGHEISGNFSQLSNPLSMKTNTSSSALTDYCQSVPRNGYDKDIAEIAEVVRILNNLAPIRMPEFNFNINEINGERYYKPDGTLLLVRDFDSDVIRDYYFDPKSDDPAYSVSRILEHDKSTGRLKVKIEPIKRAGSKINTSIAIFDTKINKKYTIMQLSEGGILNNISEFSGKGKSFQTLFRNIETFKPVRYLEGKDDGQNGFEMIDCLFSEKGDIVRIKRYNKKREVNISYTQNTKNISIKTID